MLVSDPRTGGCDSRLAKQISDGDVSATGDVNNLGQAATTFSKMIGPTPQRSSMQSVLSTLSPTQCAMFQKCYALLARQIQQPGEAKARGEKGAAAQPSANASAGASAIGSARSKREQQEAMEKLQREQAEREKLQQEFKVVREVELKPS